MSRSMFMQPPRPITSSNAPACRHMESPPFGFIASSPVVIGSAAFARELSSNPEYLAMSKSSVLFIITMPCSATLFTGALSPQSAATSGPCETLFHPQSPPTDAGRLLDEVIATLTPSPTSRGAEWLSMTIWQKMTDGENSFEAEGRLLRGPKQRIRLELDVKSQKRAKVTHTCDGVTLRQVVHIGSEEPVLYTYLLPGDGTPATAADREAFLEQHGIADFLPLLRRLRDGLKNPTRQTGMWQDLPTICIAGEWSPRDDTPAE